MVAHHVVGQLLLGSTRQPPLRHPNLHQNNLNFAMQASLSFSGRQIAVTVSLGGIRVDSTC